MDLTEVLRRGGKNAQKNYTLAGGFFTASATWEALQPQDLYILKGKLSRLEA